MNESFSTYMPLYEGIIPMNFNFNQAKQSIQTNYTYTRPDGFDPILNMNDPEVRAQILAKFCQKRDEESTKQQRIANFNQYARNIIYECSNAVNNLVIGNRKVGFSKTDADILAISITNKLNEILNSKKLQIDNRIMLENCNAYSSSLLNEYQTNINRYKLENNDSIGFNTETGTVIVNPLWMFEVIKNWINQNFSHQQEGDQLIYG